MATLASEEFYVVLPAEATNEVTNPSYETGTTGHTAVGAGVAIARSSTYQRRGLWSLEVTPASGVQSGVYFGTVNEVNGASRTFSVDVYNPTVGQAMRIGIYSTAGAMQSEQTFTSNGYWQRIYVTRTGTANVARRLYVLRDAVVSTAKFYVDGFYYGAVNGTYLDGDMKGFLPSKVEYRWNGTPHASTSWRSGQTRSGGTLLHINDYCQLESHLGLGMAPVENIAQDLTIDRSSYQTTRIMDREFILRVSFAGTTPGAVQVNRQVLLDAIRPDKTAYKQPLIIHYEGLDATGGDASEPLDIACLYVDGLENQPDKPNFERVNLRFRCYQPLLQKAGDSGAALTVSSTVANFNNIVERTAAGTWQALTTGANGIVYAISPNTDKTIYAAGAFALAGGVANTVRIAKWDGNAWTPLGTGADGTVYALCVGPDGTLYAGGAFHNIGGVAAAHIAKWSGGAWSALGAGTDDEVRALAIGPGGYLYVGGLFDHVNGAAISAWGIGKWDGAAWSVVVAGSGGLTGLMDGISAGLVYSLVYANGKLYVGGSFDTIPNPAGNQTSWNMTYYDGTNFVKMNGLLAGAVPYYVNTIAVGPDGAVYAGGLFDRNIMSVTMNNVAKWSGSAWIPLSSGLNNEVHALAFDKVGNLYAGGDFTTAGGVPCPSSLARWDGSTWVPVDADLNSVSNPAVYALAFDTDDNLYIGFDGSGSGVVPATTTVTNAGGAQTYPVIQMTGPGTVYQLKDYTTGKSIFFQNLTLLAGETALLDLRPQKVSFISSFRGNMMSYILPGSEFDFPLLVGANSITTYMTGTTAASSIAVTWQDYYWSIDGAKR